MEGGGGTGGSPTSPRLLPKLSMTSEDFGFIEKYKQLEISRGFEDDQLVIDFLKALSIRGKLVKVINWIVEEEVQQNRHGLLREGSLGSSLLRNYWFHYEGTTYLKTLILPVCKEVSSITKKGSLEIDPMRCEKPTDAKKNSVKLLQIVSAFLGTFIKSNAIFPKIFAEFMRTCYSLISEEEGSSKAHLGLGYSDSGFQLFGAFFVLRFICPAIVTPFKFGITKKDYSMPSTLRGLVLVSKVIQGIANHTEFVEGGKEPYMSITNDFIKFHYPSMMTFIMKIVPDKS